MTKTKNKNGYRIPDEVIKLAQTANELGSSRRERIAEKNFLEAFHDSKRATNNPEEQAKAELALSKWHELYRQENMNSACRCLTDLIELLKPSNDSCFSFPSELIGFYQQTGDKFSAKDEATIDAKALRESLRSVSRFCELFNISRAELDAQLQAGVITLSHVKAILLEDSIPQVQSDPAPVAGMVVAEAAAGDSQVPDNVTATNDPNICSRILAREFSVSLEGNFNALDYVKAVQIWKAVYFLRTAARAPKETPQTIPGLFTWTFKEFQGWFKYHKDEFLAWVKPPNSA